MDRRCVCSLLILDADETVLGLSKCVRWGSRVVNLSDPGSAQSLCFRVPVRSSWTSPRSLCPSSSLFRSGETL